MRRFAIAVAVLASLLISSTAWPRTIRTASALESGASAGSTYSANWLANYFMTYGSGYDKTVTFIRNTNYGWYNTKRGTADYLETYAPFDGTYQGALRRPHVVLGQLQCSLDDAVRRRARRGRRRRRSSQCGRRIELRRSGAR
jgi:hypothetical protein